LKSPRKPFWPSSRSEKNETGSGFGAADFSSGSQSCGSIAALIDSVHIFVNPDRRAMPGPLR